MGWNSIETQFGSFGQTATLFGLQGGERLEPNSFTDYLGSALAHDGLESVWPWLVFWHVRLPVHSIAENVEGLGMPWPFKAQV